MEDWEDFVYWKMFKFGRCNHLLEGAHICVLFNTTTFEKFRNKNTGNI